MQQTSSEIVACPYCGKNAALMDGEELYGVKIPEARNWNFWVCRPCGAWVGTHKGTKKPLGSLANGDLRVARIVAHFYFDPLWKAKMAIDNVSKKEARSAGYAWLSEQMGIKLKDCHIGMFNVQQCQQATDICKSIRKRKK